MIDSNDDARMWEEALKQKKMMDPLKRLSERRTNTSMIISKKFTESEINEIKNMMQNTSLAIISPAEISFPDIEELKQELEAATKYIAENEVIHKKVKKNIPTVIEYQGRRYTLDPKG